MGRPPCCDKVGIKKGPWTPEEDIILVTYIQEHGPGNWRSVPTNTGLLRCSKSCRLRWTNYLRPGIKRGNFTPHEEGMIVHLQALLGNKWAAIASYLPQRTDNDIKNYWNTHLKKKLKKFHSIVDPHHLANGQPIRTSHDHRGSKSFSDRRGLELINDFSPLSSSLSHNQSLTYASSTENISRLLEGWMRSSPKTAQHEYDNNNMICHNHSVGNSAIVPKIEPYQTKAEQEGCDIVSNEELDSISSFDQNMNNVNAWDKSSCDSLPDKGFEVDEDTFKEKEETALIETSKLLRFENDAASNTHPPPLSFLEKWLLDESVGQLEDMMELSPIF